MPWLWKPALAALIGALPALGATQVPPSASDLLARVRAKLVQNIAQRRNYTCVETIERRRAHDGCPECESMDRLRLEVAVVDGKERFAWPGSSQFEDKALTDLVSHGTIGSGDFAGVVDFVFFSKQTSYSACREEMRAQRRTIRCDYRVPAEVQGYRVRGRNAEARVGFHGSFWVDAGSLDLVRLETVADDIPANLQVSASRMAIEYEYPLPQTTELRMLLADGIETTNTTRFSACRQFTSDSSITFGAGAAPATAPRSARKTLALPPGVVVDCELAAPISMTGSAVGDPIAAVVTADVRFQGTVAIPKGARLGGRIRHLADHRRPAGSVGSRFWESNAAPSFSAVGIEFTSVAFNSSDAGFRATLQKFAGRVRDEGGRAVAADTIITDRSWGSATMLIFNERLVEIPKGFWMRWKIVR